MFNLEISLETAELIPLLLIVAPPIGGLVAMLLAVVFDAPRRRRMPTQRFGALGGPGGASTYGPPIDTYSSAFIVSDTGSVDCGPIDCGSMDCGTSGCD
jgi:hypothetical protein